MEWIFDSSDLKPIENVLSDTKYVLSEAQPSNSEKMCAPVKLFWAGVPGHRYQTFQETEVIQQNIGSVIHMKAKPLSFFCFFFVYFL